MQPNTVDIELCIFISYREPPYRNESLLDADSWYERY